MKCFFTAAILIVSLVAKGQIVNIPDSTFKKFLVQYASPVIDTNNDGEIEQSEALAVIQMNIYRNQNDPPIRDLTGIGEFKNLIDIQGVNADTIAILNIQGLNNLTTINISADSITPDCFNGCSNLKEILIALKQAENFKPVNLDSLQRLVCLLGNVNIIDVRDCKALSSIYIFYLSPSSIVNALYASNLPELRIVDVSECGRAPATGIKSIDLHGCSTLERVSQACNGFTSLSDINLDGCHNLQWLDISSSKLTDLDLRSCYNLPSFIFSSSVPATLNIKNGRNLPPGLAGLLPGSNICADDFEVQSLKDAYRGFVNVSSYCTFFPGGPTNTITGRAIVDLNSNGCDSTDRGMEYIPVKITDTSGNSLTRYTFSGGNYRHYAGKGIFTIEPYFPYPYFTVNPSIANISFDTANNLLGQRDFCIQPNGAHNDLEITLLPTFPPARPGFDAAYTLVYKNRGTTTLSGNVHLNFDNSKMNFISASENVSTQSTGQLTWNYNTLQPFESKTINVTFNLLPPPVNNIDDTLVYLAAITPSAGDETQFDNSFILPQRVIGSYDPNDKQCLEGSKLDISKIGDYLHYQIRFQNEGTDTAFNVVVADTLSDKLDWNTFEFIKASHPVDVRLTNNKAEFIFENIHLPYKAINEPASNGWVAFKIRPKPSVVIGDSLNNSAAIYFDFNLPVITNTAATIVSSASSPVPVKLEYFSINKKESSNQLNWKASCTTTSATFVMERSDDGIHFKSIGNINATSLRCQLPFSFTDNSPAAGKNYYRLKITDAEGKSFYSKVLVVGNNKAGLEIKAIANNTIYISSNKQQTVQMKVIAADGKEIWNERKAVLAGDNNISLQMKNAVKGIYSLLVYTNEGETIVRRFIQ